MVVFGEVRVGVEWIGGGEGSVNSVGWLGWWITIDCLTMQVQDAMEENMLIVMGVFDPRVV